MIYAIEQLLLSNMGMDASWISRRNLDRQSRPMAFSKEKKMTDRTVRGQRVFVLFSNGRSVA